MNTTINKEVYVFKRDKDCAVRRSKHVWYDTDGIATVLDGRDVLPGFELKLWQIDEALSQVCFMACNRESYPDHHLSQDSSESESSSDDDDVCCPTCAETFTKVKFVLHYDDEHLRRKRKPT